jgi:hypothetical protein
MYACRPGKQSLSESLVASMKKRVVRYDRHYEYHLTDFHRDIENG